MLIVLVLKIVCKCTHILRLNQYPTSTSCTYCMMPWYYIMICTYTCTLLGSTCNYPARLHMISSVHLSVCQYKNCQIYSGILVVGKCDHNIIVESDKKLSSFCFLMLGTRHEGYKLCNYVGHAYQPHLA